MLNVALSRDCVLVVELDCDNVSLAESVLFPLMERECVADAETDIEVVPGSSEDDDESVGDRLTSAELVSDHDVVAAAVSLGASVLVPNDKELVADCEADSDRNAVVE